MNQLKRHLHPQSTQAGFTIIESLMALMVVSILMVALSPVIVLSVATRVQARRVELASQAARTYIDGVRAGVIPAPPLSQTKFESIPAPRAERTLSCDQRSGYCTAPLGQVGPVTTTMKVCAPNANPPCSSTISPDPTITVTTLYCVNLDEIADCKTDSTLDMIVQAVGYHPDATNTDPKENYKLAAKGYELGIRVYRASAFKDSGNLEKSDDKKSKQAAAAVGTLGNSKQPLLEITTAVAPQNPNFGDLQKLLQ